jgi:hypothetical protein
LIELSNVWSGSEENHAQIGNLGMKMRFNAESFDLFPPEAARWVVAHELAHVYQKVCGRAPRCDDRENEREADQIAEGWGFDKSLYFQVKQLTTQLTPSMGFEKAFEEICRLTGGREV